jgi:hypothetical protein
MLGCWKCLPNASAFIQFEPHRREDHQQAHDDHLRAKVLAEIQGMSPT